MKIKVYNLPSFLVYSPLTENIFTETIASMVKRNQAFLGSWPLNYCQNLLYKEFLEKFFDRPGVYQVKDRQFVVNIAVTGKWILVLSPEFFQEIMEEQTFVPLSHSEIFHMDKIYHLLTEDQKQMIFKTECYLEAKAVYWRTIKFINR